MNPDILLCLRSLHHQVELAIKIKSKNKLYDFNDFVESVKTINNGKVVVKSLEPFNFSIWPDLSSKAKLKRNKVLLKDIVELQAERGNFNLKYRSNFSENFKDLNFLLFSVSKVKTIDEPERQDNPRGINEAKKKEIIDKLLPLMPENRKTFWFNLPTSSTSADLIDNYE